SPDPRKLTLPDRCLDQLLLDTRGLIDFAPLFEFSGCLNPDTVEGIIEVQVSHREQQLRRFKQQLELENTRQLQLLHFCLFLAISLAALLANGLIISAVACGHHLHTPMFFFLLNLALSDLGCICITVPKAMHNSLWDTSNISCCSAQFSLRLF
ncbi:hypothetical protein IHE44_0002558, partial [Lamprotornis superbus]